MVVGKREQAGSTFRHRYLDLLIGFALMVVTAGYVGFAVSAHEGISPFDEYVYADYLFGLPEDSMVSIGEETGVEARDLLACRGVIQYGAFGEPCGDPNHSDDSLYPYGGGTGADIYTPIYFVVTWALAQPVSWLTGLEEFDASRAVGGLWAAAGAGMLFVAGRVWSLSRPASVGIALAAASSPVVFWANTYVSTDAPSLLCGAAVLALAGAVARHRVNPWWFATLLPLVVLVKVQHILLVLLIAVWALMIALRPQHAEEGGAPWWKSKMLIAVVGASVLTVVAQGAWLVVRAASRVGPTVDQGLNEPLTLPALASEATRFLGTTAQAGLSLGLTRDAVGTVISWLCVAGVLGLGLARERRWTERAMAMSALTASVIGAPLLAIAAWITAGVYVPLQPRYGISLLPVFLLAFALLIDRVRWQSWMLAAVGGFAMVTAIALPYEL